MSQTLQSVLPGGADFGESSVSLFYPWPLALKVLFLINIFIRNVLSVCCVLRIHKDTILSCSFKKQKTETAIFLFS